MVVLCLVACSLLFVRAKFGDLVLVICRGVVCFVDCLLLFVGMLCIWWPVSCYFEGRSIFGDLFFAICRDVLCLHCDVVNFVGHQH